MPELTLARQVLQTQNCTLNFFPMTEKQFAEGARFDVADPRPCLGRKTNETR